MSARLGRNAVVGVCAATVIITHRTRLTTRLRQIAPLPLVVGAVLACGSR